MATLDAHDALPKHTALITGGTSGLGLACAAALLRSTRYRWDVLIVARDRARGEAAVQSLNQQAGRAAARFFPADLASLASVRSLTSTLQAANCKLDALVCNAGVQYGPGSARSAEGYEATFAINHLGHFLLVMRLAPLLNEYARLVVVSSSVHDPTQRHGLPAPHWVDPKYLAKPELDPRKEFEGSDGVALVNRRRYTTSKLCNLYFTYELARRLENRAAKPLPASVTINAFDPGLMPGTGLGRYFSSPQRFVWRHVLPVLRPLLRAAFGNVHSSTESGAALADMLESERFASVSGRYFEGPKELRSSVESYDANRAATLWSESERLTAATSDR